MSLKKVNCHLWNRKGGVYILSKNQLHQKVDDLQVVIVNPIDKSGDVSSFVSADDKTLRRLCCQ